MRCLVLTRFASWEVIHQRHHQFTDDVEKDPHPAEVSYWRFLLRSIVNVEVQLSKTYMDTFGDTPENRRIERIRSVLSAGTGLLLLVAWYQLLGAHAFWFFLIPTTIGSVMFVTHFNWCTHNATSGTGQYYPVDLDHGYYWIGNRLFFGIYYHKIHHDRARLFNPMLARKGPPPPVEEQRPKRRVSAPAPVVESAA